METTFADNDSLAALLAAEISADLLLLLTDVPGVYDRPPSDPMARLLKTFNTKVHPRVYIPILYVIDGFCCR